MYNKLREELFIYAGYRNVDFMHLSNTNRLVFIFSENKITQRCDKTCGNILKIGKSVTETVFE